MSLARGPCVDVGRPGGLEAHPHIFRWLGCALLALSWAASAAADESEWFKPLGDAEKASRRRVSSGEPPPLPLPATPVKRTERKRPPAAPTLIRKVVWGETAPYTFDTGESTEIADWNLCPADLGQLLLKAGTALGQRYGSDSVPLASFEGDPETTPVLFFSGSRSIRFDPTQLELIRGYVLRGGMVIADNVAGSPYFYESFAKAMGEAFPESPLRMVPLDHPVFHLIEDATRVGYPKNVEGDRPLLEAVYVGCRLGVVLSRYGLGCGWDDREVPLIEKAAYYDVASANRIGVNLVAYAIGYSHVAREEAKPELFGALDEQRPTDELVFAQLRHGGHWNVHPGGAASLLRFTRQNTSIRTSLKRVPVTAGKDDLSGFTLLYLTGLDRFELDEAAAAALKAFLEGEGTLIINNGLGLATFDAAVRAELKKVLPDAALEPLPLDHPAFKAVFNVAQVKYNSALPGVTEPRLEGIAVGGDLRVIYSPFDLEAGWQGCEHPMAKAYAPESAMQLGVNLIMYALTH